MHNLTAMFVTVAAYPGRNTSCRMFPFNGPGTVHFIDTTMTSTHARSAAGALGTIVLLCPRLNTIVGEAIAEAGLSLPTCSGVIK